MTNIYDKLAYIGYVLMIIFYSNQIYEIYNSNPIYYSLIFGSLLYIFSMLLSIYDKYTLVENFKPIPKKTIPKKTIPKKSIPKKSIPKKSTTMPINITPISEQTTNVPPLITTKTLAPTICPKQEPCPKQEICPKQEPCPIIICKNQFEISYVNLLLSMYIFLGFLITIRGNVKNTDVIYLLGNVLLINKYEKNNIAYLLLSISYLLIMYDNILNANHMNKLLGIASLFLMIYNFNIFITKYLNNLSEENRTQILSTTNNIFSNITKTLSNIL